ncbi:MAG TPA: A24 family peptidase [Tepidisphaeraceae bacterium]|nr:A24 family peptidase [Tepidisphaeraceae bacterium]
MNWTHHLIYIAFLFALGSCIGSFLNVVVWRWFNIPHADDETLIQSFFVTLKGLSDPPSHCPKCDKLLKWYDNIPVLGWLKLGGKCRFCKAPISVRYPIVEFITGAMFAGYYIAFFICQIGPCAGVTAEGQIIRPLLILSQHWWIYALDMALLSALLAASLIDIEQYRIPIEIPWLMVPIALAMHAIFDHRGGPGNLAFGPIPLAMAMGAAIGTILSLILLHFGLLPRAFADGAPLLEIDRQKLQEERDREAAKQEKQADDKKKKKKNRKKDREAQMAALAPPPPAEDVEREWAPSEIRREISKEMLFLLLPMALAMLCAVLVMRVDSIGRRWEDLLRHQWIAMLLGSALGGLAGGFAVWLTRILGSILFGREAMGMGDVDLMVAIGAVLGPGPAIVVFFVLAPFLGLAYSLFGLIMRKKHELPYGPYLSLGAALTILFYAPIAAYFAPGLSNAVFLLGRAVGGG